MTWVSELKVSGIEVRPDEEQSADLFPPDHLHRHLGSVGQRDEFAFEIDGKNVVKTTRMIRRDFIVADVVRGFTDN
jgi:hypothetical protein